MSLLVRPLSLRRHRRFVYAHEEWQANTILRLQRLAHEGLGLETWSRANETVPITEPNDILGVLCVSDDKHPKLVHPPPEPKTPTIYDADRDVAPRRTSVVSPVSQGSVTGQRNTSLHGSFYWEPSSRAFLIDGLGT